MCIRDRCVTSSENDVDFKRLEFAKNLIDKFESHYQVGICKFTGSYKKMVDFTPAFCLQISWRKHENSFFGYA